MNEYLWLIEKNQKRKRQSIKESNLYYDSFLFFFNFYCFTKIYLSWNTNCKKTNLYFPLFWWTPKAFLPSHCGARSSRIFSSVKFHLLFSLFLLDVVSECFLFSFLLELFNILFSLLSVGGCARQRHPFDSFSPHVSNLTISQKQGFWTTPCIAFVAIYTCGC